ncbi:MAG: hypothetical protein IPP88_22405 [Betaproteobacteria bacterium]|nr:hypothetical protein [Betaproteobacteria bacterium]
MKILIAVDNIFNAVGGGQRFFSGMIKQHPEYQYFYFTTEKNVPSDSIPQNATPIFLESYYRTNESMLDLEQWRGNKEIVSDREEIRHRLFNGHGFIASRISGIRHY